MKHTFIAVIFLTSYTANAQKNTVSTGGDASGSNGSVSYTVGQIDYLYVDNGTHNANAGVQQPFEFYAVGIDELQFVTSLYPNPTHDQLHLNIDQPNNLSCKIYDAAGKLVHELFNLSNENIIDVQEWAKGNYNLVLLNENEPIETVKIIKH